MIALPGEEAVGEVRGFALRLLAELPAPATLVCEVVSVGRVHLTTSRAEAQRLIEAGEVVLTPREYEALAVALADGAVGCEEALERVGRKCVDPLMRVTRASLLGHVRAPDYGGGWMDPGAVDWTVGDLLDALGAELVTVHVEGQAAVEAAEAAA